MRNQTHGQPGAENARQPHTRFFADVHTGLTAQQVAQRVREGLRNEQPNHLTKSTAQIWLGNLFNLFNILNIVLAVLIVLVGYWENTIFLLAAIGNTAISIVQELRAKRTIDRLAIVARARVTVVRDGRQTEIGQEELVLDDILLLKAGDQVCADGEVVASEGLEADESLLTGESDTIKKPAGAHALSGSFITAGRGFLRVEAVGESGFAARLAREAKKEKKTKSELINTINTIIRVLTVVIVPVGALLFYTQLQKNVGIPVAVLGASSAMLGMIPEGLILLTGVTLAVSAVNLARRKTLVQSLPCIETLARADVLCLDKTGTITDGNVKVTDVLPQAGFSGKDVPQIVAELMNALGDDNATARALRTAFPEKPFWRCTATVPFTSRRKWSGAAFAGHGSFLLGAPEMLFGGAMDEALARQIKTQAARGLRVLCLAHADAPLTQETPPDGLRCLALILLADTIRPNAAQTFRYLAQQGLKLKVISGDSAVTVSRIAAQAGLAGAEHYVDMSKIADGADLTKIVEHNTVFGRVSPYQKRELIRALQKNGHTACMTGDGVNDVLALREADCGVAMAAGADAARSVADFVLLDSDFSAMVEVLKEGRRVINNIEQVASLYLVKTIYSTVLSVLYMLLPFAYPFAPLQLTPVNMIAVGLPSLVLALRPNYAKPRGRFGANVMENALPAALIVIVNILIVQLAGVCFDLSATETSTMDVFLIGVVGFVLLFEITRPQNRLKSTLLVGLCALFLAFFLFAGSYFMLGSLLTRDAFFYLPLTLVCWSVFHLLKRAVMFTRSRLRRLYARARGRLRRAKRRAADVQAH